MYQDVRNTTGTSSPPLKCSPLKGQEKGTPSTQISHSLGDAEHFRFSILSPSITYSRENSQPDDSSNTQLYRAWDPIILRWKTPRDQASNKKPEFPLTTTTTKLPLPYPTSSDQRSQLKVRGNAKLLHNGQSFGVLALRNISEFLYSVHQAYGWHPQMTNYIKNQSRDLTYSWLQGSCNTSCQDNHDE